MLPAIRKLSCFCRGKGQQHIGIHYVAFLPESQFSTVFFCKQLHAADMAPITREQALENALASSRIEGYEVTEQTRADCRRLMDGKVDARTLAAEILARRRAQRG